MSNRPVKKPPIWVTDPAPSAFWWGAMAYAIGILIVVIALRVMRIF